MHVTSLSDVTRHPRRIAVGEFDGVHLGHRAVIDGSDTVLTFEPHPLVVVHPEVAPKLLTSLDVKIELIESLGVEELVVIPFDHLFAEQSSQEFIDSILVQRLDATTVSVGENFRFGNGAAGDSALLVADGRFETRVVPLVEADGEVVSSSRIRALVASGEVEAAGRLLGAPFRLRGEVVDGDRRGRTLGFPTANVIPNDLLACPGHGVYACVVGERLAAVNVGVRPRAARRGLPARLRWRSVRRGPDDRVPSAVARRVAVRLGASAHRPDAPRRRADARAAQRVRRAGRALLA